MEFAGLPRWSVIAVGGVASAPLESSQVDVTSVANGFEALGALAAHAGRSAEPPVVIVAGDSVPDARAAEFVEALRRVSPGVRVGVARARLGTRVAPFDFEIEPSWTGATLRASLSEPASRVRHAGEATTTSKPERHSRAAEPGEIFESGPSHGLSEAGEQPTNPNQRRWIEWTLDTQRTMWEELSSGGDVLGVGLDYLRRALTPHAIEFHPVVGSESNVPPPAPGTGGYVASVRDRGRTLAYLVGPLEAARTLDSAASWLGSVLGLRERQSQLKRAAFTDSLTGAWNRRSFERFLAATLDRARDLRRDASLLLFDIDNFKRFNDLYGHPAGDDILRETVRLLNSVIRPSDRVCRIGGDEFAVIFDDPQGPRDPRSRHPASIFEAARRFQRQIESARFPKLGAHAPGRLTISGGLATFPWDASDLTGLIARADALVLESKRLGKDAICIGPGGKTL